MDERTYGDVGQREAVAYLGLCLGSRQEDVAYLESVGCDDVCLGAILVVEEGDASRTVGIVLDCLDDGGNAVLVSLKVYDAVFALVATTKVAGGEVSFGVNTAS